MIPTKISGKGLIKRTKQNKSFDSFVDHKEMGNCTRTGMNNWRRSFTKHTRQYIKSDTEKEIEFQND